MIQSKLESACDTDPGKMHRIWPFLAAITLFWPGPAADTIELPAPIFREDSVFEMRMEFDYDEICMNPVEQDCEDAPGVITYQDANGDEKRVEVRLRTRGRWRKDTSRCEFPALFVFFNEETTAGTVFEGESMLPLTTHCKHHYRNYTDYLQTEYLAHRFYALLTETSLHTRLLRVRYADANSRMSRTRYGFLIEHFDRLGARTNSRWVKPKLLDLSKVRAEEMATLAVFQFMIANLDWSALKSHNVALFEDHEGTLTPVPYDFDYSGLVYTPYASPPTEFPVYSVTTRYFRGFCWPDLDWQALFDNFRAIEAEVYDELKSLPRLSTKEKRRVRFFLKAFYDILENDDLYQKKIIDRCRDLPDSLTDYTIITDPD